MCLSLAALPLKCSPFTQQPTIFLFGSFSLALDWRVTKTHYSNIKTVSVLCEPLYWLPALVSVDILIQLWFDLLGLCANMLRYRFNSNARVRVWILWFDSTTRFIPIRSDSIRFRCSACHVQLTHTHTHTVCVSHSQLSAKSNWTFEKMNMLWDSQANVDCRLSFSVLGLKVKIKGSYVVVSRSIRLVYMCFSVAILVLFTNLCWIRISVFVCVFVCKLCIRFSFPLVLLLFILYRQITMLQQLQVETIQRFICSVFLVHSGI